MVGRQSYKPEIIRRLFRSRQFDESGEIVNPIVSIAEVGHELEVAKQQGTLGEREGRNPANFFKDIIRHDDANRFWPSDVFEAGYTGEQSTGDGNVFAFKRVPNGQTEPFPNILVNSGSGRRLELQTASVNLFARSLGISSETWLIQVLVQIKAIETHFSLVSPRRERILQIDHLQIGKKGSLAEIDALFLATERGDAGEEYALILIEAKQQQQRIVAEQIQKQIMEAIKLTERIGLNGRKISYIIPCALKSLGDSEIYFREFDAVSGPLWKLDGLPEMASEAVYTLKPKIVGI